MMTRDKNDIEEVNEYSDTISETKWHLLLIIMLKILLFLIVYNLIFFFIGYVILRIRLLSSLEKITLPLSMIMAIPLIFNIYIGIPELKNLDKKSHANFAVMGMVMGIILLFPTNAIVESLCRASVMIDSLNKTGILRVGNNDIIEAVNLNADTSKIGQYTFTYREFLEKRSDKSHDMIQVCPVKELPNVYLAVRLSTNSAYYKTVHKQYCHLLIDNVRRNDCPLIRVRKYDGMKYYLKAIKTIDPNVKNEEEVILYRFMDVDSYTDLSVMMKKHYKLIFIVLGIAFAFFYFKVIGKINYIYPESTEDPQ